LKVLIHGINFAPEMIGVGRYTGELAEHLSAQGHSVEVVTAAPHYPGWKTQQPYSAWHYSREMWNGVKVIRCPMLMYKAGRGIGRLLAPLSFSFMAAPVVLWRILRSRPDAVLCVEPTLFCAPAAVLGAKLAHARCVLHVQDLEVDAAFAVGHLSGGFAQRVALGFERWMLRHFDRIVTISQRMREKLADKGVSPDRIAVVRNWVDLSAIKPLTGPNSFRRELGLSDDAFVVLYGGHIGAKQALHLVFEAAESLSAQSNIHFVIAGDGPLKEQFKARFGHLPNLHLLPLQPEGRLCELLNLADLHVLPQAGGAADLVLPSKLGGMLASGKPVLVQADEGTELHDILRGHAILVGAGDLQGLTAALLDNAQPESSRSGSRQLADIFAKTTNLGLFLTEILPGERQKT
jgi:colanic acid biosynthesis glycosyl transferase WcaI